MSPGLDSGLDWTGLKSGLDWTGLDFFLGGYFFGGGVVLFFLVCKKKSRFRPFSLADWPWVKQSDQSKTKTQAKRKVKSFPPPLSQMKKYGLLGKGWKRDFFTD